MNPEKKWFAYAGKEQDVILNTQVFLSRNIEGIPFVRRLHTAEKQEVIGLVREVADSPQLSLSGLFTFISMETVSKAQAVSMAERGLVSPEYIARREGKGVLCSQDEALSIVLNGDDHLLLHTNRPGLDLEGAYDAADRLERILSKGLSFSFDSRFGYLTQNPANLGTGMHASLTLHLPALSASGSVPRIAASLSRLGMDLREGMAAEGEADIYRLTNRVSLGISEQEALFNLKSIGLQIVAQEREARKAFCETENGKDRICRAMGTLLYAQVLPQKEAMELLSSVYMGVSQGIFAKPEYSLLAEIMENVQPATLSLAVKSENSHTLDIARAKYIQERLQKAEKI